MILILIKIWYNVIMKKNDIYEVEIIDIGNNGEGIGKIDNIVIFIPYAIKGELIKALILKVNKNFAYGKIIEVIRKSDYRITPPCPYFGKCGGCNLQHIEYSKQLEYKTSIVETTLRKQLGSTIKVNQCVGSDLTFGYRNKMQLPITIEGIGMYKENSHNIVKIDSCLLCKDWIKTIILLLKIYIEKYKITLYDEVNHFGLLRHILIREIDNSYSVTLVINGKNLPHKEDLIKLFTQHFEIISIFYCINTIKHNTILTQDIVCIYGNNTQKTKDFNIEYFISPTSFLQINRIIQNKIYSKILNLITENDVIIDAYSGAGLLSAILSKKAKLVYGIEIVESATKNANELIQHNNISNVKNINGDCSVILPKIISTNKNASLVLDPPRKGCDSTVLNSIVENQPKEIFYISCNPSTLARDLKTLQPYFEIDLIQPYDMFPQTKHIETLTHLYRKETIN